MKTWTLSLAAAAGSLLLSTQNARADQCAWNDEAHAAKAEAILAKHPKVIAYCEPCGDKAPGEPFIARDVTVATPQDAYREVSINGQPVDLAYTFVQVSSTKYKNLAKMVGCPASGVSSSLEVADETPTGVLITPTEPPPPPPEQPAKPLPDPIEPLVPQMVIAAPTPPAPPPIVSYYNTTVEANVGWFTVALAGCAGFLAGLACAASAVALRRRRAMKPRAHDLPIG
jgi:hypothetical protein